MLIAYQIFFFFVETGLLHAADMKPDKKFNDHMASEVHDINLVI